MGCVAAVAGTELIWKRLGLVEIDGRITISRASRTKAYKGTEATCTFFGRVIATCSSLTPKAVEIESNEALQRRPKGTR